MSRLTGIFGASVFQLKAAAVVTKMIIVEPEPSQRRALQLNCRRQWEVHLDGGKIDLIVGRLFANASFRIDSAACEREEEEKKLEW